MKIKPILGFIFIAVVIVLLIIGQQLLFRKITLPPIQTIKKIAIFSGKANWKLSKTKIMDPIEISEIYEFMRKKRYGWEQLTWTPRPSDITASFSSQKEELFEISLDESTCFFKDAQGVLLHRFSQTELFDLYSLLGVRFLNQN